jgi:hypothetical protein
MLESLPSALRRRRRCCRPFPIILGSLIQQQDPRRFFPFEFTPLYYGMPPLQLDTQPVALGGGLVEPLGFNSAPPTAGVVIPNGSEVSRTGLIGHWVFVELNRW